MTSKLAPEFKLDLDIYLVAHDFLKVCSAIVVLTIYDMQSEERGKLPFVFIYWYVFSVGVIKHP